MSLNFFHFKCQAIQKTKYGSRLLFVLLAGFLLAALLTITKYLIAPAVITKNITSTIKKNWSGEVSLKGLKFHYLGRISFDELICLDDKQRKVIHIKDLKAFLPNLLLLQPKVENIQIASSEFDLFGPIKKAPGKPPSLSDIFDLLGQGYLDIKKLEIKNLSLTVHSTEKDQLAFKDFWLDIARYESGYEIKFKNDSKKELEFFSLEGAYDSKTGKSKFEISMDQTIQPEQAAIIAKLFGSDPSYLFEGSLRTEFKLSQPPEETDIVSLDGFVEFDDWNLIFDQNDLIQDFQTKLIVEENLLLAENFSGKFCEGIIEGKIQIEDWKDIYNCFWKGKLIARDIDLSVLAKSVKLPRGIKHGKLSFDYIFTGKGDDLLESIGEGSVVLKESDLFKLTVISQIERKEGLKPSKARRDMNANLEFRKEGSIIVITKGRITNPVWAVKIEPGAKVDLKNKTYDMHVVFVPLAQIEEAFKQIPFTEILVNLKDQLTRLRVKGSLTRPKDNVLEKEQFTDVKDPNTAGFVRDLLKSPSKSD